MKIKQNLKCVLTLEEIAEIGRKLGNLNQEQARLKLQAKEAASQYKARIDSAQTQIEDLSSTMNCGYEYRSVDCDVLFNTPTEGRKTIVRSDTDEIVEECPMTDDEIQDLFINGLGAHDDDHEFVFRDKSRCRMVSEADFLRLKERAEFKPCNVSPVSETELVDMKPEHPEITVVVMRGNEFEMFEFVSGENQIFNSNADQE